jgi:purine-binding chemotaxis protein CheW
MASDEAQYVTLCLGAEVFAAPVSLVREILDYRECFRIPEGPEYLLGLIDVRGRGTPVIDLRTKLGLARVPPNAHTRIMVLDVPIGARMLALGLVADRVLEVATFRADQIEAAPDVGVAWASDYIAGVVRRDEGFVVLFDMARLLTTADIARLTAGTAQAA